MSNKLDLTKISNSELRSLTDEVTVDFTQLTKDYDASGFLIAPNLAISAAHTFTIYYKDSTNPDIYNREEYNSVLRLSMEQISQRTISIVTI